MPKTVNITFLGTCSGGGPIPGRNCSSLAIDLDNELWLVDCAEGTQMQLTKANLRVSRITRIFITHMHVDHVMGLVPLICTLLYGLATTVPERRLDIYGPSGLRMLLRTTLTLTGATLSGHYAVHELLHPGTSPSCPCPSSREGMHLNEALGSDITPREDGAWPAILDEQRVNIRVDAGPLIHRVPCIGYVFTEPPRPLPYTQDSHFGPLDANATALLASGIRNPRTLLGRLAKTREPIILPDGFVLQPPKLGIPGRKLVILGDTSDPSGVEGLATDATLLVHEATNAYVDVYSGKGIESEDGTVIEMSDAEKSAIRNTAISRGHSTAEMAGEFAQKIGAKKLVMNHFSTKYPAPGSAPDSEPDSRAVRRTRIIRAIENQATRAWIPSADNEDKTRRAVAATDLMILNLP